MPIRLAPSYRFEDDLAFTEEIVCSRQIERSILEHVLRFTPKMPSKARKVGEFCWSMVSRDLHIQISSRIAKVLRNEDCALLADKESSLLVRMVSIWQNFKGTNKRTLTLKVLQPTLSGQIDRSQTLRPLTPCTLRRSSTTPPWGAIELPSRGAMLHVPRQCQVVST